MLSGVRAYLSLPQMGWLYLRSTVHTHILKTYSSVKTQEEIISIYSKSSWYPRENLGEVEAIKAVRFKNIKEVIITSSANTNFI